MEQSVEDSGGECGVTEAHVPVVDNSIGGDQYAGAALIASMQDHLQIVGARPDDVSMQEQVVEDQEVGVEHRLEEPVSSERGVGDELQLREELEIGRAHV